MPDSVLFLTVSMLLIATILYLPNHIMTISRRTYYYFAGDATISTSRQAAGTATKAGTAVLDAATTWAQTAYQAAMNKTAAAAQEVASEAATAPLAP